VPGEGQAQVAYDFEVEGEATDWTPVDARDFAGRAAQRYFDGLPVTPPRGVDAPWTVHRKMLVGYGWTRRAFLVPLRTDHAITVEVEARGRQNALVGLQVGDRTFIVGLGYVADELPVANLGREEARLVGQLNRSTVESRKRGPSAVILREGRPWEVEEL